jgi:hypothetical protein
MSHKETKEAKYTKIVEHLRCWNIFEETQGKEAKKNTH